MASLNHKPYFNDVVKLRNILTELLIENLPKKVLFVGEGDFTFTVAFAALRERARKKQSRETWEGVWDNIISTRYEPEEDKEIPNLCGVKDRCIESSIQYSRKEHKEMKVRDHILSLPPVTRKWLSGCDARSIPPLHVDVIWFQCPWIPASVSNNSTYALLSDFLLNLAENHALVDTYVCVGITTSFPYIIEYNLEGILGEYLAAVDNSTRVLQKYTFIGADDELVQKVLSFGYHHQTVHENKDIHSIIKTTHLTLIFQAK